MPLRKDWEQIKPLGSGGQSTVYLVRTPQRAAERAKSLGVIRTALDEDRRADLALAIVDYARDDKTEELGALKEFDKVRRGAPPEERLKREIEILESGHQNLPKLLDSNLNEKWLVTEYFRKGVLENDPNLFRGDALKALRAFRPLAATVGELHQAGVIHRDIKPANVFIADDERLILGDFGIAFTPEQRVTATHERVGPWDYMPQWADTGTRLDDVKPSFDIYMLGKLLWCMISGRYRLPREYHRLSEYNLATQFPNERSMHAVNLILDKCLVEHEDQCLQLVDGLLRIVDEALGSLTMGFVVDEQGKITLPCLACGRGYYKEETTGGRIDLQRFDNSHRPMTPIVVRLFICTVCTHRAFFGPTFPEEAMKREWKPW